MLGNYYFPPEPKQVELHELSDVLVADLALKIVDPEQLDVDLLDEIGGCNHKVQSYIASLSSMVREVAKRMKNKQDFGEPRGDWRN